MIKMDFFHYLNGRWVDSQNLKISAFDLSLLRGFGVFDFLRTYNRKPFLLKDHLDRLFNSAKILGIKIPKIKKEIEKIVFEGIKKNPKAELNIRLLVTGGIGPDSVTPGQPSLIVIFTEAVDYPKEYYQKGVKVITYPAERIFPKAKSLNYLAGIVALQKAKKQKAVEAIYIDKNGRILEGTTSNFFAVINNQLVTPKEEILFGITRKVVINLAKKLKIPVKEEDLYLSQIKNFSEAFLTASNKEIMPVVRVDNKMIGNGRVGEITKRLMKEFWKLIKKNDDFL